MATRYVYFKLGRGPGNLTCEPTVLHARQGDIIKFSAYKLPFSVVFKDLSPLSRTDIRSNGKTEEATVRRNAQNGVYPFACAVFEPNRKKINMAASCPTIIIDPGFRG